MSAAPPPELPSARPGAASLVDPPVVLSSLAAVLAGALIGGAEALSAATVGVVLAGAALVASSRLFANYYDRDRDTREHPERPLPSGEINAKTVYVLAWVLLLFGLGSCAVLGQTAAAVGLTAALLHSLHAAWLRRIWGVNYLWLGLLRASLLALGATAAEDGLGYSPVPAVCIGLYATGWAALRGSRQPGAPPAAGLVSLIHIGAALAVATSQLFSGRVYRVDAALYLIASAALVLARWVRAVGDARPAVVLEAVQWGFLALTLLEASFAAGTAGFMQGLLVAIWVAPLYSLLKERPIPLILEPR